MSVTSFTGTWRPYQELALTAFEADRAAGRHQSFIVCPPGSGKTLIGWEAIARIGAPALVLVPGRTVLEQWRATAAQFGAAGHLTESLVDEPRHVTCLTYQSLCTTDAEDVLGELAHRQVAQEVAALRGIDPDAALDTVARDADYPERLRAARRALTARATKGQIDDLEIRQVLSGPARARLAALREAGIGCVVLDECHHLSSLWGRVIRHVLEELGEPHVVALTATPDWYPSRREAELLDAIHGPVDFQVPTPAVVRDGYLAPYLTLAAFCVPTEDELATLRLQDEALRSLIEDVQLFDGRTPGRDEDLSFVTWATARLARRAGPGGRRRTARPRSSAGRAPSPAGPHSSPPRRGSPTPRASRPTPRSRRHSARRRRPTTGAPRWATGSSAACDGQAPARRTRWCRPSACS